jgi:hypothetical protein
VSTVEYIVGLIGIISVFFNIGQWIKRQELRTALRARSQAAYNYFYWIAHEVDKITEQPRNGSSEKKISNSALQGLSRITGIASAARNDLIAYSREHLNFVPFAEHAAKPVRAVLPEVRGSLWGRLSNRWKSFRSIRADDGKEHEQ